ncbi:MAG: efflux RND transporter periplasmic adaptor subunit [Holophaga sp.]|nr:efflux RND transporter periplasmic adaptor subunit [Holophaga sp.]
MKRNLWIGLGSVGILLAGSVVYFSMRPKEAIKWRQAKVERGNITQKISATGTVSAMVQVAVGTQVSGVISALYADYNSLVKKGQIIAQIDPTILEINLRDAEASLQRAQATFDNSKADFERNKRLAKEKLVSVQDLDTKETTLKTASGNLESAQASVVRAKANLAYCNITAPVDGVVIARLADVGQTVAASFSTPNLFQIAQDLSKMKIEVSIDEADIDEIKKGQKAFFTVDSLPDKQFAATVSQVRLEPTTNQNVVTYKVVLEVPNEPLPGSDAPENANSSKPEGRRMASAGAPGGGQERGPAGDMNPDQMWERMKDRIQERNPGITKEDWIKRMKERMKERTQPAAPAKQSSMDRQSAAHTPGGVSQLGGPTFSGNLALRPGMTANVTIMTNSRQDVFKVPNASLRFNPNAFLKDEKKPDAPRTGRLGQPMSFPGARPGGGQGQGGRVSGMVSRREDKVWVMENGKPKSITVKAGLTDGQFTEVSGEDLKEGMEILIGVEPSKTAASPMGGMPGGRR